MSADETAQADTNAARVKSVELAREEPGGNET